MTRIARPEPDLGNRLGEQHCQRRAHAPRTENRDGSAHRRIMTMEPSSRNPRESPNPFPTEHGSIIKPPDPRDTENFARSH